VLGASYDGREDGARGVVTGESGLAHTGAVVNNESLDIIITHGWLLRFVVEMKDLKTK
jgi:hypothetical protein